MSATIFELIHSLSQTERRHFTLYSSFAFETKQTNYLHLFHLISKQKQYNEKLLIKENKIEFFAQKKRHLFLKIIASLKLYHQGNSVYSEIDNAMSEYRILLSKKLIQQAKKSIKRAYFLATIHEQFADILKIKTAETELLVTEGNPKLLENHFKEIKTLLPKLLKKIENKITFEKVYVLFVKMNQEIELIRSQKEKNELKNSLELILLQNEKSALSLSAKLYQYYIKGIYNFLIGDFEQSLTFFHKQFQIYEKHPQFILSQKNEYAKCLANVILLSIKNSHFDVYEKTFSILKSLKVDESIKEKVTYWNIILQIVCLCKKEKFKEANSILANNNLKIIELENYFESSNTFITERNYLFFSKLNILLFEKDIKNANKILQHFLNNPRNQSKGDSYNMARILSLFIHLELEKTDLLENEIQSVKRYLKDKNHLFQFEKVCLNFISSAIKKQSKIDLRNDWKSLYSKLQQLRQNEFEKNAFHVFDLLPWVKHKTFINKD
jgi:hypothetical protein